MHEVTVLVCSTCRSKEDEDSVPTPGAQLFAATREAQGRAQTKGEAHIMVRSVECLGNCKRCLSAAILTDQCWSYVFGDLRLEHADDLLTGARLMTRTQNGLMPWQGRPQCLKSGMIARLPPLTFGAASSNL